MKKLFRNTFHFAYANFEKSFRAAYATFPPPSFRLRMTYASLARPCAHQGFQRLFLMPYAEACAPLTQPFRPRCLSSNFSEEHLPLCLRDNSKNLTRRLRNLSAPQLSLTHDLRIACATLRAPGFSKTVPNALRGSLRTAYATLPPAVPFQ